MPPIASLSWDAGSSGGSQVTIDCFLPTGVFIPLQVFRDATLADIKEELWQESQKYPLYSNLKDKNTYVFMCINQMAEKEELLDEEKRLGDVKPFQRMLKVVEKKGDRTEKIINSQISFLIGKGLHEFEALKSAEVSHFREHMKKVCKKIGAERDSLPRDEKAITLYPPDVSTQAPLPNHLNEKLHAGNLRIAVRLENLHGIQAPVTYTQLVPPEAFPQELVNQLLLKKSDRTGTAVENKDDFILKVCGREEYLLGNYPLSQYNYIRKMVAKEGIPQFLLVNKSVLTSDAPPRLPPRNSSFSHSEPALPPRVDKKRKHGYCAWDLSDRYGFTVHRVTNVMFDSCVKLLMRVGIYHGGEILCGCHSTGHQLLIDSCATWNDSLTFDLQLADIPRMARLCFLLYALHDKRIKSGGKTTIGKTVKEGKQEFVTLAWVNIPVYDYKDVLRMGQHTLYMWPITDDNTLSEELLNPIGTVECNPDAAEAVSLTVTFKDYNLTAPIYYPMFDKVLEVAAKHIDPRDTKKTKHIDKDAISKKFESLTFDDTKVTKGHLETLRVMIDRDPLTVLHEQDKELIWMLRYECRHHFPQSLPKLLRCVQWNKHQDVAQITAILKLRLWPKLRPTQALELLDFNYADKEVRSFAVECLQTMSDMELETFLLQLVQVLKYESYLECDLVELLMKRALNNQRIGHQLFWLLRSEMHVPSVSVRFGLILELYCRGNIQHMKLLTKQVDALAKLSTVNELVKEDRFANVKSKAVKDKAKEEMSRILNSSAYKNTLSDLFSSLDPSYKLKNLRVEKCRFMDSKMRPLWLVFENSDPLGEDVYIMYKNGDDLRQDMLTLQMIRLMDSVWQAENLDLRLNAYGCMTTGCREGLIEIVLNSETVSKIQQNYANVKLSSSFNEKCLYEWLKDKHRDDPAGLSKAVEEFRLSCAAYCVATCVLGIGDRHSDNIMLKENGQMFHIDFGHILGHFKSKFGMRRERVPFVLAPEFVYLIRGGSDEKNSNGKLEFEKFRDYCERAFLALHRKSNFLIMLFMMMMNTGIPEVSSIRDIEFLRDALKPDCTEEESLQHFREKFKEAESGQRSVQINNMFHNFARKKDNS